MSTLRPYIVMTSSVPGKGTNRKLAIVQTTGVSTPSRIDVRLESVVSIWSQKVHGPENFDKALAAAYQICSQINDDYERDHSKLSEFTCPKCDGEGRLPGLDHVEHGVCFCCDGKKVITRGAQWNKIYYLRKDVSEADRKKIDWIFNATPAQWASVPPAQIQRIADWVAAGPFSSAITLPPPAVARLDDVLENLPKPY